MSESDGETGENSPVRLSLKDGRLALPLAIIFALVLVFGFISGVFLYRLPVLIVTDSSFSAIYGPKRLKEIESRLSRKLFRRVIPVYVDENAGPDIISFAVEDASKTPLAVLFPHRYMGGADYYKENHPDIPVYVASGRNHSSTAKEAISFVRTDIKTDLYRAGLCAAMLAGEEGVVLINYGTLADENKDAFTDGLQAQGYTEEPVYRNPNYSFSSSDALGCAVIVGMAGDFFIKRPTTPVILFSWTDPAIVPSSVKVMFDDSPYALADKGFSAILESGKGENDDGGSEVFISSVPTVFKDRIKEKADFLMLENFITREFQN